MLHGLTAPRLAIHPLRFSDHAIVRPECPASTAEVVNRLAEALLETRAATETIADGDRVRFNVGWATYPLGEVRVSEVGDTVRADYTVVVASAFSAITWVVVVAGLVVIASLSNGDGATGWGVGLVAVVVISVWIATWQRIAYRDRISKAFVSSVRAACAGAV